jgi:hypothetical protein
MSVDDLRSNKSLKFRFLQMDSQHRCVPADWYIIGYDMFAMHTFLRLSRTGEETDGYLKSYFERNSSPIIFFVDYKTDFPVGKGLGNYLSFKSRLFVSSLVELLGLLAIIKTISSLF